MSRPAHKEAAHRIGSGDTGCADGRACCCCCCCFCCCCDFLVNDDSRRVGVNAEIAQTDSHRLSYRDPCPDANAIGIGAKARSGSSCSG